MAHYFLAIVPVKSSMPTSASMADLEDGGMNIGNGKAKVFEFEGVQRGAETHKGSLHSSRSSFFCCPLSGGAAGWGEHDVEAGLARL